MKYRIVIFDDNKSRRDSLRTLISMIDDMECVGEFEDCRQVLDKIKLSQPDLVLMDIDMPHVNGVKLKGRTKIVAGLVEFLSLIIMMAI